MTALVVAELTSATLEGSGVFDVLMKTVRAHLDDQFKAGRIKGPEYSTVYLGSLDLAMQAALRFTLELRKNDLEAQLLAKQIEVATVQVANATAEGLNIPKQGVLLDKQALLVTENIANAHAEGLNIPKQGRLLDAQVLVAEKQIDIADAEIRIKEQQVLVSQAEVGIAQAKLINIPKEGLVLDAQKAQMTQQTLNLTAEKLATEAKTALIVIQKDNALLEGAVLVAQECKLRAEFDLTQAQTQKSAEELALLAQKVATEKAQTTELGVDANSVVGRQKALYQAQTDGFKRDAEQKVAKMLIDSWSVRRTTDEGTVADGVNKLQDATIGRAVDKMLTGVGA